MALANSGGRGIGEQGPVSDRPPVVSINRERGEVTVVDGDGSRAYPLGSAEGFALASSAWLRAGWDAKYVYSFTWLGRPIIQLPDDVVRLQELIYSVRPDVIVETGVAHGGTLVFAAGLCKIIGRGRAIGVDIEIRPQNRAAIEAHPLSPLITLIEGSSTDERIVAQVREQIRPDDVVLVLLDSSHTKAHVLDELRAYSPMVTCNSYIVAMDGIMGELDGAPRTAPDWRWNNPRRAALEFVAANPEFVIEEPPFAFNEGSVTTRVTYWPDGFIKRVAPIR